MRLQACSTLCWADVTVTIPIWPAPGFDVRSVGSGGIFMKMGSPRFSRAISTYKNESAARSATTPTTIPKMAPKGSCQGSGLSGGFGNGVGYSSWMGMSNSMAPNLKPDTRLFTTAIFFLRVSGRNTASLCSVVSKVLYAAWRSASSVMVESLRTSCL